MELLVRYAEEYKTLKGLGHSPAKALEILLDASRGDAYALAWIKVKSVKEKGA